MFGAGAVGIIQRWLQAAGQEPEVHRRVDLGGLALVLASLKEWYPAWKQALKEFNMRESQFVQEWINEGEVKALQRTLRVLLEERFGPLSEELLGRIAGMTEPARLDTAIRQVLRLNRLEELQL
jgi:hypothetical protein